MAFMARIYRSLFELINKFTKVIGKLRTTALLPLHATHLCSF